MQSALWNNADRGHAVKALSLCALILALSGIASSAMLANAAEYRYTGSSIKDYRTREAALAIAESIAERFNALTSYLEDYEEHPVLESIRSEFGAYGVTIEDVSSGLHLDFLRDEFLGEIAPYVFAGDNADSFIALRNRIGLTGSVETWKPLVKEEAFPDLAGYGWLNRDEGGDYALAVISASRGTRDEAELFPVLNTLPSVNINTIRGELLTAFLSVPSWKISAPADKAKRLTEQRERGALGSGTLRTVLALPQEHPVYRYLGVKTQFWRAAFRYEAYNIDIILAAVPEEGSDAVAEYKIVERRISREKL
jgi:hypothetical protein